MFCFFRRLIENNNFKIGETQKTVNILLHFVQECRSHLDALQAKEKVLERTFKKEFVEMTLVIQEAALKLYKYENILVMQKQFYIQNILTQL